MNNAGVKFADNEKFGQTKLRWLKLEQNRRNYRVYHDSERDDKTDSENNAPRNTNSSYIYLVMGSAGSF